MFEAEARVKRWLAEIETNADGGWPSIVRTADRQTRILLEVYNLEAQILDADEVIEGVAKAVGHENSAGDGLLVEAVNEAIERANARADGFEKLAADRRRETNQWWWKACNRAAELRGLRVEARRLRRENAEQLEALQRTEIEREHWRREALVAAGQLARAAVLELDLRRRIAGRAAR
jgi:hypothetical protein